MNTVNDGSSRYVTLLELSKIAKVPISFLYERTRRDALPGQVRIGRHIRVDLAKFIDGAERGVVS